MSRLATKAVGNRYYEARMKAAKYNEKLLTRAGAVGYLPGVTEDSLKGLSPYQKSSGPSLKPVS